MVANDWLDGQHATDQRRFQHLLVGSFVAHAIFVALLAIAPSSDPLPLPAVLSVDLVASLPAPRAAPAPRPVRPPAPAPPARPVPKPAPPVPKEVVLPKQAPKAVPKRRVPPPPTRPQEVDYEDALSQLRNELGESAPADPRPAEDVSDEDLQATTAPGPATGAAVDREVAAWVIATKRHVRSRYITPPEFLNRSLATGIEVNLTTGGQLVGTPRVVRPSGDPFFDDNAVRAVLTSAPLPAPPRSGSYTFVFTSEDR